MPSYTSVNRIYQQLPAIGSMTTLSSAQVLTFVEDAENEINARLAPLYTVPVTGSGVPPILETLATNMAQYRILSRRVMTQEKLKESGWVDRFKEDSELLQKIADGGISLVDSSGTIIAGRTDQREVWSNTKDYLPTFTELGDLDQVQDPDKIDDLADERDL